MGTTFLCVTWPDSKGVLLFKKENANEHCIIPCLRNHSQSSSSSWASPTPGYRASPVSLLEASPCVGSV